MLQLRTIDKKYARAGLKSSHIQNYIKRDTSLVSDASQDSSRSCTQCRAKELKGFPASRYFKRLK